MSDELPAKKARRPFLSTWRGRVLAALALVVLAAGVLGGIYHREIKWAIGQRLNTLPHSVWQRLHSAKSVTLYSLYPEIVRSPENKMSWMDGMTWDELLALPRFNGYPALGKFECSDTNFLRLLADDLRDGTQSPAGGFLCFLPRHGVLLTDSEGTLEIVICFECERLHIYEDGELSSTHILMLESSSQSPVLWNAEYTRRGIRMARTRP